MLLHPSTPPMVSYHFLVLKSLAILVPQNVKDMRTDDAEEKKKKK